MDWSVIKEKIRVDLKRFLNKQTVQAPLDFAGNSGSVDAAAFRARPRETQSADVYS